MSETTSERRLADAVTKMEAALLTVQPELSKPYTDEPRLTPWDRFAYPAVQRLREAHTAHAAEVDALRKELALVGHARDRARRVADERGTELKELRADLAAARAELDEATKENRRLRDKLIPKGFGQRNAHCSNCGDERGGPVGHEISECRYRAGMTAAEVAEILPEHRRAAFWELSVERYLAMELDLRDPAPAAGDTAGQDGEQRA